MRMYVEKGKSELSKKAAQIIIDAVKSNPFMNFGLATGQTPIETYQRLIEDHQQNHTSYSDIQTFNLDEYVGLTRQDPNSYHSYMKQNLFQYINIKEENAHIPNGLVSDTTEECNRYEDLIKQSGGIDLQILGIGQNGHIGFNEPNTPFSSRTHIVNLAESTRLANSQYFTKLEDVPKQAITMGIQTIMEAKSILLLVSGQKKAEALNELLHGNIREEVPATVLRNHRSLTIIADEEALLMFEKC
ncbi:glucosamine-6-phosphate deaminase [Bacillus sp. DJP31]|uniref:glucosamine-6-phosphate deaminase n=1 Tax=Bacillus sp. DJP31 TaxID=3409789 RepID=UPI003BB50D84